MPYHSTPSLLLKEAFGPPERPIKEEMGGSPNSSSSGEEDENPLWKAAVDSIAATSDFSLSLSKAPTKPTSSLLRSDEHDDGENKPKSHAFKLYQIKASPPFISLSLSLKISLDWNLFVVYCSFSNRGTAWVGIVSSLFFIYLLFIIIIHGLSKYYILWLKEGLSLIPISKWLEYSNFDTKIWNSFLLHDGCWSDCQIY